MADYGVKFKHNKFLIILECKQSAILNSKQYGGPSGKFKRKQDAILNVWYYGARRQI
jgi:hypothetical protein